jgi:transposase
MAGFVEGVGRGQVSLFPAQLDDYVADDNPVRAVDAFVDGLDLGKLGFTIEPLAMGRPGYRPATMIKIYIYAYLNRIPSSRRIERECQRNVELIWLTGKLAPDHKTIADFRKDNGKAIREVCREGGDRDVAQCPRLQHEARDEYHRSRQAAGGDAGGDGQAALEISAPAAASVRIQAVTGRDLGPDHRVPRKNRARRGGPGNLTRSWRVVTQPGPRASYLRLVRGS